MAGRRLRAEAGDVLRARLRRGRRPRLVTPAVPARKHQPCVDGDTQNGYRQCLQTLSQVLQQRSQVQSAPGRVTKAAIFFVRWAASP